MLHNKQLISSKSKLSEHVTFAIQRGSPELNVRRVDFSVTSSQSARHRYSTLEDSTHNVEEYLECIDSH